MAERTRKSFLLGAATNWLAFAAILAVSFFLTPYLIRSLGKPRYDIWCVVEAILAYFTLLDFGIAACLVRYVAKHHASENREEINRFASSSLAVFLVAALAAIVVGMPAMWLMTPRLQAKIGGEETIFPFMVLMLINLALTLPLSVFPSVLDGLERYPQKSLIRVVMLILRTAGLVYVVSEYHALFPLAVVYTVFNILEHGCMAILCWRYLHGLKFTVKYINRQTLHEVRTYSIDAFLALLAGRITLQTGAIIIGLFLPAGQVTFFTTAARLIDYAKTLLRTITATLSPGVSAMEAKGDWPGITRLLLVVTRWVLYIVLPVNIGLLFFGKPFLDRWVGSEFIAGSFPSLAILSATLTVGVAQSAASRILYGLGRLRWFARAAMLEAGLNLILTACLIGPFGVEGVAIAVTVPNLLFCLFVLAYTISQLQITWSTYLRVWIRPLLGAMILSGFWWAWGTPQADWWDIFSAVGSGLIVYGLIVAFIEWRFRHATSTPRPTSQQ